VILPFVVCPQNGSSDYTCLCQAYVKMKLALSTTFLFKLQVLTGQTASDMSIYLFNLSF